jgi:hypothetical protein
MNTELKQNCFVVMSFRPGLKALYEKGIKSAVESLGISCHRVDETQFTETILENIRSLIERSYFVVADISDARPNCYYEIGVAHGLGRPVILTKNRRETTHFDLTGFHVIEYSSADDLRKPLRERVIGSILTLRAEAPYKDKNRGAFGLTAFRKGKLLTAVIVPTDSKRWFRVRASVFSVDPKYPLKGKVKFFLHPSYDPRKRLVEVVDGVATVEVEAYGAYTIGARLADGTELELDLKTIPGGSKAFYKR